MAESWLRQGDVRKMYAQGSPILINVFQYTSNSAAGVGVDNATRCKCERPESLSALKSKDPIVKKMVGRDEDGNLILRKIKTGDIFQH